MEDKVLETVINGVGYTPLKDVLVKPLEPIKLKKEITEAVGTGEKMLMVMRSLRLRLK